MATVVKHSSRKHALLSASGASRWMNCTPSARLEEKQKESASSVYAQEGTLAHEFGDLNLRLKSGQLDQKTFNREVKKHRKHKLYTDEMEPQVDKYVTIVMESFAEAKAKTPDAVLMVEERLDFSHLVEQGFGTGDANIIGDGVLEVIDLKYGKGVKVHAESNPQLMLYGSGALREFEMMYDIHTVRLTIIQPRLDHVSTWDISVDDLLDWGSKEVKPKAKEAYLGEGLQKAGSWCKWCKVKGMCATLAAHNIKLARHEFRDPHFLDDKQIVDIYEQIPMLVDWAQAVGAHMLDEALGGKDWPGYKIVEGKSQRKWTNEQEVVKVLEGKNFKANQFMISKLAGLGDIEKLVGKADFQKVVGDYVLKPPGKPTVVPMADKRPAMGVEQAKVDFADLD